MKFSVQTKKPDRKLVAVIGVCGDGYFHMIQGTMMYTSERGCQPANHADGNNLESLLSEPSRIPVYDGDILRITF